MVEAVKTTLVPVALGDGGAPLRLGWEHVVLLMSKVRMTFPDPTKTCPPASLGVVKWVTPKLALW